MGTTSPVRTAAAPKPGLTRERVLDAALELVDTHGLEALTMRSLGQALGVEAMSLYRYFPSKAELLTGLADRVLSKIRIPAAVGEWREDVMEAGRSSWRALVAHPNVVPLLFTSPLDTPASRAAAEGILRLLVRAGFEPVEAHRVFRMLQAYLFGAAMMFRASPPTSAVRKQIAALTPAGEFPLLRAALSGTPSIDHDADFELGLSRLIDAIAAGRRQGRSGRRRPR